MPTANQQTLAESGTVEGILMRNSMDKGPYKWKEIADPNDAKKTIQYEPHVNASRAKKATRNHDILALVANSYANPSHSHARDAQEDKLSTAMMLLTRAITQHYSTPTNNHLRTSSNTRNQAVIQDGRMDIQSKNVGYAKNGSRNARRTNRIQATNAGDGFIQKTDENEEIVQRIPRTMSTQGKTNMMLVAKDEVGVNLDTEENNFMLINAYGDNQLEEINALVIMIARIQPTDNKSDAKSTYGDHEHKNHEKFETIKHTSINDQIDSDIIFDDPYVEDNSGQAEHDPNPHDQTCADIESLIYNVQVEAKNQRRMKNELKKAKCVDTKET
ncbi:hypothetical protein Tco_1082985 [Tanacetum coccineum]|uniref:Uncharacterized protein n=1 Tax=Tanacetum coccineum TaxID=301880 RepID=A0ABQ5I3F3_9ASTR